MMGYMREFHAAFILGQSTYHKLSNFKTADSGQFTA